MFPRFRAPSAKRLIAAGMAPGHAVLFRALLHGEHDPDCVGEVADYKRSLFYPPRHVECLMRAANVFLNGFGVEVVWGVDRIHPEASYVNTGDTYSPTILYDERRQTFAVTSFGDWVEAQERRGRRFD